MEHNLDLGDCVRMTTDYIADYCERTKLDEFGYIARLTSLRGTVMGVRDDIIEVDWDDGDKGIHEPKDLEVCEDTIG